MYKPNPNKDIAYGNTDSDMGSCGSVPVPGGKSTVGPRQHGTAGRFLKMIDKLRAPKPSSNEVDHEGPPSTY